MDYAKESLKKHYEWKGKIRVVTDIPVPVSYTHLTLPTTPYV